MATERQAPAIALPDLYPCTGCEALHQTHGPLCPACQRQQAAATIAAYEAKYQKGESA